MLLGSIVRPLEQRAAPALMVTPEAWAVSAQAGVSSLFAVYSFDYAVALARYTVLRV